MLIKALFNRWEYRIMLRGVYSKGYFPQGTSFVKRGVSVTNANRTS